MDVKTNNSNEVSKYKCRELRSSSIQYKLVKSFFETTKCESTLYATSKGPTQNFKVYKIIENRPTTTVHKKRKNLMLFHGTNERGVEGILKEGFKNSKKGTYGQGVYMTDCSHLACDYSDLLLEYNGDRYVFVNEVLESEKLQTYEYESYVYGHNTSKPDDLFEKHVIEASKQPTVSDYKEDSVGRRYRNIPHDQFTSQDEYLADESIVVPRYLIEIDENDS